MGYFNTFGQFVSDSDILHIGRSKADGAKRGSGRYPIGSGERPYQHESLMDLKYHLKQAKKNKRTAVKASKMANKKKRKAKSNVSSTKSALNSAKTYRKKLNKNGDAYSRNLSDAIIDNANQSYQFSKYIYSEALQDFKDSKMTIQKAKTELDLYKAELKLRKAERKIAKKKIKDVKK